MTRKELDNAIFNIRPARLDEFDALNAIRLDAEKLYGEAYSARPMSQEFFSTRVSNGDVTVIVDKSDFPCGFAMAHDVEQDLYLRYIFMLRSFGRRGLGTRLLKNIIERAEQTNRRAITLTTSGSAPWNAPYYSRFGFITLSDNIPSYMRESFEEQKRYFTMENFPRMSECVYCLPRVVMEKPII